MERIVDMKGFASKFRDFTDYVKKPLANYRVERLTGKA